MATSAVPRWKTAITNALAEYEKSTGMLAYTGPELMDRSLAVFQLASIDPTAPVPHVRSHLFREFVTPSSRPSLPLVLTTTDIRTPKAAQIISNPHVELAWWIEGTQEQYRISGLASAIPAPTNSLYKHFLHNLEHAAPNSAVAILKGENFDWEAQRNESFRKMSAYMKATWCRPTPGIPLQGGEEEAKKWPVKLEEPGEDADEETKKNWETALGNFALLIIDPIEVDYIEFSVVPNRRTRFWRTSDGSWEEGALVP
ncbi:hypothetical protein H0H87_006944 [Tephrocybe sp. NHM501043]|nr:hypothetical protein H0H87_006944 [Tephrocybe sp. NHM501043]